MIILIYSLFSQGFNTVDIFSFDYIRQERGLEEYNIEVCEAIGKKTSGV